MAVHDSALDELDEDNVGLRFRNTVTVSLAFLLLARCGFRIQRTFPDRAREQGRRQAFHCPPPVCSVLLSVAPEPEV